MRIQLNLVKSLILEAVKQETFIKGQVDKDTTENVGGLTYHETAGGEEVHERKLVRIMYSAVEELKSHFADYLDKTDSTVGDNVSSEISDDSDSVVIYLNVSDRFNTGYTATLARLSSSYIENKMLSLWWNTINANQASLYDGLCTNDLTSIKRAFTKLPPATPKPKYTTEIGTKMDDMTLTPDEHGTVTYTIDGGAIDDIEYKIGNNDICECWRGYGKCLHVRGKKTGFTTLTLYSHHNGEVKKDIHIVVTNECVR